MDFGALPPEINSARMYAGPGPESMLAAAAAWNALAGELHSAAASYASVISELTGGPWVGPSSDAMEAAAAPYMTWITATAGQAELAATQAQAAASAYQSALTATVPPPTIAANRTQLAELMSSNVFGQNTAAIAANEAQYGEMWAQDAAAMYNYAANSAANTATMKPFTAAPPTTNAAGSAAQAAAATQAASTSTGTGAQSTLSQLLSSIQSALQSLGSPSSSTSGLSETLSSLLGGSSTSTGGLGGLIGDSASGFSLSGLLQEYATYPGFFGLFVGIDALAPLLSSYSAYLPGPAAVAPLADAEGAAAAEAAGGVGDIAGGVGNFADPGAFLAGVGGAESVGALAVPPSWGWTAAGPAAMLGSAPMLAPAAMPLEAGAGLGVPFMFPGLPRGAAGAGVAAVAGTAAAKYGSRLRVMTRPPAAGYAPDEEPGVAATTPKYPPSPAGFPTNGHAPPGYRPAVIYVPTNGHAPADA